jgi:hypothetical protein
MTPTEQLVDKLIMTWAVTAGICIILMILIIQIGLAYQALTGQL